MSARTEKYSAWRSRWTIWVATGSGLSPSFRQTYSSTEGSIKAKVPTAPEIFPQATASLARIRRSRFLFISWCHMAIFKPKVTGSAWIP